MRNRKRSRGDASPAQGDAIRPREELVAVRAGPWRLLVPMRHVERVLAAAMPAARPSPEPAAPAVALGGALVPVVFAHALVGAEDVRLCAQQQMILLADGSRRALLWVDAVEDVVEHVPAAGPESAVPGAFAVAWSGPERPLPVLDVPRILAIAA